jgi:hypothetical protein
MLLTDRLTPHCVGEFRRKILNIGRRNPPDVDSRKTGISSAFGIKWLMPMA